MKCLEDCEQLQFSLDRIHNWCTNNNLPLNIEKCKVMSFSLKHNTLAYGYSVNGILLDRVATFRDLGVILDSKLSFIPHINDLAATCFRSLGFIIRNSRDFSNIHTLKLLFYAFVRSKIEYASVVWSPYYQSHVNRLERVQRRFLKYLSFKLDARYPEIGIPERELLRRHSVCSLEDRRTVSQLKFLHNILHNKVDCSDILNQLNFLVSRAAARQADTFYVPTPRTNICKFSPISRMCNAYNAHQERFDIFNCSSARISIT